MTFPQRSDFASAGAYAAWWYVREGAGRRTVCSTDGGALVSDLTALFRQMRWEWGSPDGTFSVSRQGRVAPTDMPPIITGGVRPPPIPAQLAAELRASVQSMVDQFAQRVAYRWYEIYLRGLRLIPGAPNFPSLDRFGGMPRSVVVQALNQDPVAYLSELQRYMERDAATVRTMSRAVRSPVASLMLGQATYVDEIARSPSWMGIRVRGGALLQERATAAYRDTIAGTAVQGGTADLAAAEQEAARQVAEQAAARAAVAAEEASIARALASEAPAVAAGEGRAIARALTSLNSLGRLGRFLRGFSAGFAIDMPRSGWAFAPNELSTDARWDAVFQSALVAYLRVSLGGATIFSTDADENLARTANWIHDLPAEWRIVYLQMVDDYNNRRVSITSVYIAVWLLSNVHTLHEEYVYFITDPRQVRGFVGLADVGVPTDAVMPPWNTPLASSCLICPLVCALDATPTQAPTSILPAAAVGAQRINDAQIRISLADPPDSGDSTSVPTSAVAKGAEAQTPTRSPWWIAGSVLAIGAGGYLIWQGYRAPARPTARRSLNPR